MAPSQAVVSLMTAAPNEEELLLDPSSPSTAALLPEQSAEGSMGASSESPRELVQPRFRMRIPCSMLLLAVGFLVALWAAGGSPRSTRRPLLHDSDGPPRGTWPMEFEMASCERCPVGECDRNAGAACTFFEAPEVGYHCKVRDCSEVPAGEEFSTCWEWEGEPFFSFTDRKAPCNHLDKLPKRGLTPDVAPAPAELPPMDDFPTSLDDVRVIGEQPAPSDVADADSASSQELSSSSEEHDEAALEPSGAAASSSTGTTQKPTSSRASTASTATTTGVKTTRVTTTSKTSAAQDVEESPVQAVQAAYDDSDEDDHSDDPKLSAYWDLWNCGPIGDDHNVEWCGGNTYAPKCHNFVDTDICPSGKARLRSLQGKEGEGKVFIGQCVYVYYAQYGCVPVSSTTTTSTSTTRTRTSSTTTNTTTTTTMTNSTTTTMTNTTTVTTTTTRLTTTGAMEGNLLKLSAEFEAKMLVHGDKWSEAADFPDGCGSRWTPPDAPEKANDLNGVQLPDVCFKSKGPHRVFVIGDWGGVMGDDGPVPADQRDEGEFVWGVDDQAQTRVASQMRARANITNPDYVLNAGDNFYWGGLDVQCGIPAYTVVPMPQFEWNYEEVYKGPGLDGKPWLGVLGNHDYGGFSFMKGWDQLIAYTWKPDGRWVMPAQYWRSVVRYPGFSVDYFFMDTNKVSAYAADVNDAHNICGRVNNPPDASCGQEGPLDVDDCPSWFAKLWEDQQEWLEEGLAKSTADWQVIVTHYPPTYNQEFWGHMSSKHGIDLFVTGHVHMQQLHHQEQDNFLKPTAWIVSGGGGGITSESPPDPEGSDDQYGFFELTLSKEVIQIQGFSHSGLTRTMTFLKQRHPEGSGHQAGKRQPPKKHSATAKKDDATPKKDDVLPKKDDVTPREHDLVAKESTRAPSAFVAALAKQHAEQHGDVVPFKKLKKKL